MRERMPRRRSSRPDASPRRLVMRPASLFRARLLLAAFAVAAGLCASLPIGAPAARAGEGSASPAATAPVRTEALRRAGGLDALFERLASADDADEARDIAASIARIWARSGSATADLLMSRAAIALRLGDRRLALDIYDRILLLEPAWTEAWMGRAHAKSAAGDAAGAASDFESALRLEPRRFDAWAAIGALEERNGAYERALDAYRRALAIDPQLEDMHKAEERLRLKVEGRDI